MSVGLEATSELQAHVAAQMPGGAFVGGMMRGLVEAPAPEPVEEMPAPEEVEDAAPEETAAEKIQEHARVAIDGSREVTTAKDSAVNVSSVQTEVRMAGA